MYQFDAARVKDACVQWIRTFFEENGPGCNAVVGISDNSKDKKEAKSAE